MTKQLFASLAFSAALMGGAAQAQSATGSGSITILRPLTISNSAGLAFGTIIRPDSGSGSVAVSAASSATRTLSGGTSAVGSGQAAASFTLSGEGGQTVSVTIPATFTLSSGANSLTVTTSSDLADASNVALGGTLGSASTKTFYVGGIVPVASTTASGAYSGSFSVTANYN